MVTDFVIGVIADVLTTVLGWMPTVTLPEWAATATAGVATIMGYAGSMGAWVPLQFTVTVALAVLAAYAIAFAIKIVRILASFLTAGGGSAA